MERLRTLHPRKIDLSLERCARLLRALDAPQRRLAPAIHIAGTNGKGSTLACIEASLQAAGLTSQAYTSPHLCRFNERIRLDARAISDDALATYLELVERANAEQPITFFEITTAAAFLAFAEHRANVLVLETGLGGRLDATNLVATTCAAVLTPIDFDHAQFLGKDLATITREKVAIAKNNIENNAVLVSAPQRHEDIVCARARDLGIPCLLQARDFQTNSSADNLHLSLRFHARAPLLAGQDFVFPPPRALGRHQRDNAALGAATLLAMHEQGVLPCSRTKLLEGLSHGIQVFGQPARLQRINLESLDETWEVLLDGAHNPHAAHAVAQALEDHWQAQPYCLILAMMRGKDIASFVRPFVNNAIRAFACSGDENETGSFLPPQELASLAGKGGLTLDPVESLTQACARLTQSESLPKRLLVAGSLYFAGALLSRQNS